MGAGTAAVGLCTWGPAQSHVHDGPWRESLTGFECSAMKFLGVPASPSSPPIFLYRRKMIQINLEGRLERSMKERPFHITQDDSGKWTGKWPQGPLPPGIHILYGPTSNYTSNTNRTLQ